MKTQRWLALVEFDGNEESRVSGYSAEDALQNLIGEIVRNWIDGEYVIDGGFLIELGEFLRDIERTIGDRREFVRDCGDMDEQWRIEVIRVADCDLPDTCVHVEFEDDCELVDDSTDF